MNNKKNFSLRSLVKKEWYFFLVIFIPLLIGLVLYPQLPEKVPTHWNFYGQVDGWSNKNFAVWFFPLLNFAIYLLMMFLPLIDPKKKNYLRFQNAYKFIRFIIHCFFSLIYLVSLLSSLGLHLKVGIIVKISVSCLFILLGNLMGKVKHNYFVGIKTPWTLASAEVWSKTHRFAAPLWVSLGIIGVLLSFIQATWANILLLTSYIVMGTIPIIYSYLIYRKLHS